MARVNDDNAGLPNAAWMKCTKALSVLLLVGAGLYMTVDARALATSLGNLMCHSDSCGDLSLCTTVFPFFEIIMCCAVNVAVHPAFQSSDTDNNDKDKSSSSKICDRVVEV
jgi:hypothetical protein